MLEEFAFSLTVESSLGKAFCSGVTDEEKIGSEDGLSGDMFYEFSKRACMITEKDFCWCEI